MFRLTRSSEFPRCWVIFSPGCSEKNTFPPVTREVTEDPYVNWCPPCLSCARFVPCCHCLCIRSFFPCHWNAGLLRLVGLKEYGLGTQSLGRWIVHCSRLEFHRLIIRTWHTAWRPEQQQQQMIPVIFFKSHRLVDCLWYLNTKLNFFLYHPWLCTLKGWDNLFSFLKHKSYPPIGWCCTLKGWYNFL